MGHQRRLLERLSLRRSAGPPAKKRGFAAPRREVSIRPPANVSRHLREIKSSNIVPEQSLTYWYVLLRCKPMYGLGDAPLAFQLALALYFTKDRHAIQSTLDECFFFFFWMKSPGEPEGFATSHVDDNGLASSREWLEKEFEHFVRRFGGATRHGLPFVHTGISYSDTDRGRKMDQDAFCQKMRPYPLTRERAKQEDHELTEKEQTAFRGLLGGLLWLRQTRLDLICDVVLMQQDVNKGTVGSIKAANALITKAKKYGENVGCTFSGYRRRTNWQRCVTPRAHQRALLTRNRRS